MFYEEEIVNKIFKCQHCSQQYDEPRLLPCGKTICSNCLHKIETNLLNKNKNELDCLMCHKMHQIPSKGFPLNEILLSLMQEKPKEVYRSEQVESLKQNLAIAKTKLDSFTFDLNNSDFKIKEHCLELRRLVQLSTENKHSEINRLNQDLIDQIDDYEAKCLKSTIDGQKQTFDKLISEISKFHIDKSIYLKGYQIKDQEVKNINVKTTRLLEKLEQKADNLNRIMFNCNKMQFEMNQNKLEQKLLGSIRFECLSKSTDMNILNQLKSLKILDIKSFANFEILNENRFVIVYLDNTNGYNIIVYDINEKTYKKSEKIYRSSPQLLINKSLKKIAIIGKKLYNLHKSARFLDIFDENLTKIASNRLQEGIKVFCSDEMIFAVSQFVEICPIRHLNWNCQDVSFYKKLI